MERPAPFRSGRGSPTMCGRISTAPRRRRTRRFPRVQAQRHHNNMVVTAVARGGSPGRAAPPQNSRETTCGHWKNSRVTRTAVLESKCLQVKMITDMNRGPDQTYSEMPESMRGTNAS
jgi:hypothetical protein